MRIFPIGAFAALAVMSVACTPAVAQEAVPVAAPAGLLPPALSGIIVEIVALVLGALGSAVLLVLRKKLGLSVDADHRSALLPALYSGLDFAMSQRGLGNADLADPAKVRALIEDATSYVFRRVPDAAKHFKLDRPAVADLIKARLPALGAGAVAAPPVPPPARDD